MTSPPPPLLDGLEEAQKICDGTSGKHVCEPEVMLIAHDAFVMLKRIFHGTRQMYDRVAKKRGERDGVEDDAVGRGGGGDGVADTEESVGEPPPDGDPEPQPEDEGMGTGLYERWTSSDAPLACKKMEAFLVWNPGGERNLWPVRGAPITFDDSPAFPFLDVEMSWTASNDLRFDVHKKEEYHLQYIDEQSTHTNAMKASVHKGVLHRLATLMTLSPDNADQSLDALYPEYAEAMDAAGVAPKRYLTLREAKELWDSDTQIEREIRKEQEKDRRSPCRQVYCEVGYSKFWSVPLHVKLKELRNKHGLKWLRLSMSYHVFPNLREMLGSDLREKLGSDVVSQNEVDRPCNCPAEHKIRRDKCIFGGKCLTKCSVYEATCLQCNKLYIGKLQPFLKERFRGHCNTVQAHCNEIPGAVGNRNTPRVVPAHTTLSSHMQRHTLLCMDVTQVQIEADHIRRQLRVDIGWSGDPIRVHRSFGTVRCKLCNMERWRILKSRSRKKCKLMNADIGIHRDCDCIRTKRFHVLKKQDQ